MFYSVFPGRCLTLGGLVLIYGKSDGEYDTGRKAKFKGESHGPDLMDRIKPFDVRRTKQ